VSEQIYGLIGEKLGHSFSPQIHNEIFKRLGITGQYNLYETESEDLAALLEKLKASSVKGFNVTIPHKVEIMNFLDVISKEARNIGAVNTVSNRRGFLTGYNTDYYGFGMTLKKEGIEVKGITVVILGTGGVSKAVTQYLIDNNVGDIIYVTRNTIKGNLNKSSFRKASYGELRNITGEIIINCTPCGMYPNIKDCPVDSSIFANYNAAIDMIYNPEKTVFLQYADRAGIRAANGLYMLVGQAVAAHEIWSGININDGIVEEIYEVIKSRLYKKENR
jgi:shikimate dehydrogenase